MRTRYLLAAAAIVAFGANAFAGDIVPPAGPVQPTDRVTLNEQSITLPHTISAPGSYVLTSNLANSSGVGNGITIDADDVTLDLNGFELRGSPGTGSGIIVAGGHKSARILNGSSVGWGSGGVSAAAAGGHCVDNIRAANNGATGIFGGENCLIVNCVSEGNGASGISASTGSTIRDCIATGNSGGVAVADGGRIENCVARSNSGTGITGGNNCVILNSVAEDNGPNGIAVLAESLVTGCTSRLNDNGFFGRAGSRFENCVAAQNVADGFELHDSGGAVINCTSRKNGAFGIQARAQSLILNNNCIENTSSGISLAGPGTRVEGNNCYLNGFGIAAGVAPGDVDCIVIRNTCGASTIGANYTLIFASYGPIINIAGGGDISLIAGPPPNDHPWANFEY